jgi:hypothetical protein
MGMRSSSQGAARTGVEAQLSTLARTGSTADDCGTSCGESTAIARHQAWPDVPKTVVARLTPKDWFRPSRQVVTGKSSTISVEKANALRELIRQSLPRVSLIRIGNPQGYFLSRFQGTQHDLATTVHERGVAVNGFDVALEFER